VVVMMMSWRLIAALLLLSTALGSSRSASCKQTEQHLFDARYFPSAVTAAGPTTLNWAYTVDGVGNIT
jgi:hypothetical protein